MVGAEPQGVVARVARAAAAWAALEGALGSLSARHDDDNAERMQDLLDEIQEAHAAAGRAGSVPAGLSGLLSFLTEWVMAYEGEHEVIEPADPVDLLKFLMAENGLRQTDLAGELGGQPVVSAILNRRRKINARQARELGRRFKMAAGAFIEDPEREFEEDQAGELHEASAASIGLSARTTDFVTFDFQSVDFHKPHLAQDNATVIVSASSIVHAVARLSENKISKPLVYTNGSAMVMQVIEQRNDKSLADEIPFCQSLAGTDMLRSGLEISAPTTLQ